MVTYPGRYPFRAELRLWDVRNPIRRRDIVKINIGSADRKLRAFVMAPVLVVVGLLVGPGGWLAIVLYALAAVMLATSAVSFCPLYALFGVRTRPEVKSTTPAA